VSIQPPPHAELARGRWHTLSLCEQMGNIGSDVDRAFRSHAQGNMARFERAFDRALELLDLTVTDPKLTPPGQREILRAREQFCRVFFDETREPDLAEYLSRYFLQFAISARRDVGLRAES
jgi:hypothetical protein